MAWLGENGIPFTIIFTKTDKLSKGKLQENMKTYTEKMLEEWEELPPILTSSAEKKEGRDKIMRMIEEINRDFDD
jgi:GTP-binding protein